MREGNGTRTEAEIAYLSGVLEAEGSDATAFSMRERGKTYAEIAAVLRRSVTRARSAYLDSLERLDVIAARYAWQPATADRHQPMTRRLAVDRHIESIRRMIRNEEAVCSAGTGDRLDAAIADLDAEMAALRKRRRLLVERRRRTLTTPRDAPTRGAR